MAEKNDKGECDIELETFSSSIEVNNGSSTSAMTKLYPTPSQSSSSSSSDSSSEDEFDDGNDSGTSEEAVANASKAVSANSDKEKYTWSDEAGMQKELPASMEVFRGPGYIVKGRYVIECMVGSGSYGWVFKAKDKLGKDEVAIKVGKVGSESELVKEVNTLVKLNKSDYMSQFRILEVFDGFTFDGRKMMVSEFLSVSLRDVITNESERFEETSMGLPIDRVKCVSFQIIRALNYLAQRDLVHTDVKPDNIMFKNYDWNEVRLIDFGSVQERLSGPVSNRAQTRCYRAPEVFLGTEKCYGHKMDIWSLGCTMAEMYTSKFLFPGKIDFESLHLMFIELGRIPETAFKQHEEDKLSGGNSTSTKLNLISNYKNGPKVNAPPSLVECLSKEHYRKTDPSVPEKSRMEALQEEAMLIEVIAKTLKYCPNERAHAFDLFNEPYFKDYWID